MASKETSVSPFPDLLATPEIKATDAYGKQYAKAIWGVHLTNQLQYNQQRQRDIINRTYAEGLVSVEKYKTRKGISNTSYLNLDFSPVNIIATTVDNIVGKMSNTPYKIQCNAIDPESRSKFDTYRANLYADMFLKEHSDKLAPLTGIPLVANNKKIPESDEEAELHLKMNYKEEASIAMEEAFNYVFSSNMFEKEREAVLRDLITIKRGAIQTSYDEDWNIKVERVDPVDIITPYSKFDDYKNIPYQAVIKSYTVGELSVMHSFTEDELYYIAKSQAGKNNNTTWNWGTSYEGYYNSTDFTGTRPWYNFNVQTLEFFFKAIDRETREFKTYKKRKYLNKVKSDFKSNDSEVITKDVQNLYEGKWIITTDIVFNYKKCNNVPHEKINGSYSPKVNLPIRIIAPGIYDMQNKSHVERMIPHEDQINLANLAMQTLMIKMKPPGVSIDIRGLMDAAKGMGEDIKPLDIVKIYEQTGNYIFSSIAEEGDVINSRVITELKGGLSDAMGQLIAVHQFQRQLINEVIGYNTAVDASSPDSNALVGVQKNAISATNNSLRPLFNAHLRLIENISKDLALRIQDCIEYDNEAFINAIGTYATKTLEYGKDLAYVQMGIKIELLPDDEEKAQIDGYIQLGIKNQQLTPSDAMRIRSVLKEDAKLAGKLLVFLEDKNRKNAQDMAAANTQQTAQAQMQSAQAASQAQAQLDEVLTNNKIKVIQAQAQMEDANAEKAFQRLMAIQNLKNEGVNTVAEINTGAKVQVQDAANKGKVIAAQVAAESKVEATHIQNEGKIAGHHLTNLNNEIGMDKTHAHELEKVKLEAKLAPKPVTSKK